MNPTRVRFLLATLLILASLWPLEASAVPGFARKYGFNCTMCHSAFPRLNDFGVRYRANGYQVPGRENIEKTILETSPPVALRTSAGYTYDEYKHPLEGVAPAKQNGLEVNGLDILSAGLLGSKIGYMMVFLPSITADRGVAAQEAALEMANIVFTRLAGTPLNLRLGRFEPAYAAFSVKRHLTFAPYEVYDFSFRDGPAFSDTQTGLEFTGGGPGVFRCAAGVVDGSRTNLAKDLPADVYARVEGVIGPGEGQTSGHRFGVTGYLGKARPGSSPSSSQGCRKSFARLGVDASLNARGWNLALQYLYGSDNRELWDQNDKATWSGGFAELSYLSACRTTCFARVDLVQEPSTVDQDIRRFTAGARYYAEDNVAAHLEYSHRAVRPASGTDATEDFVAARIDFAF